MLISDTHIFTKITFVKMNNHGKDFQEVQEQVILKLNNGKFGSYNCLKNEII